MSRYFISTCLLCYCFLGLAQEKPIDLQPKDTVVYKDAYGLRVGIDLSRLTIAYFEPEYTGLELVGDYRITKKLYLAGELGNETRERQEDVYNYTASGSYLKLGIDYNTYGNWYGENNMIHFGGRLAYSNFSQTLNNYQIFDSNRYWNPDGFAEGSTDAQEFGGRSKVWIEAVLGIKTELFTNIFIGGSLRMGALLSNPNDKPFPNPFIPGFNKVTEGARFGLGYNFTVSYFIPFYKKTKKPKATQEKQKLTEEENEN